MSAKQSDSGSARLRHSSWPEVCLVVAGLLALGYCGIAHLSAQAAMRRALATERRLSRIIQNAPAADDVLGTITIPQLHLSAPITPGIGKLELIRGVGHIPGTAVAGGLGTMALAGHRDTFFRSLRRVTPGMLVRVGGTTGVYHYQVDSTEIVSPEQVSVLDIDAQPELVLITCFPFDYIGAAPKRFIVHAHLLSAASDE